MAKRTLPADVEIGRRIRMLRMAQGMSQTVLAEKCGVAFQQIQKYEKGTNRVGGSRMQQIAHALGVTPADFFEATGAGGGHSIGDKITEMLTTPGALRLLRNYERLAPAQRHALVQITAAMVDENEIEIEIEAEIWS